MILVYTGNGKGKTSACLGQAVRAIGCGMRCAFIQFMKKDGEASEQKTLRAFLGEDFRACGIGFFIKEETRPDHRKAAVKALEAVSSKLDACDVVIADESIYALGYGLISEEELKELIAKANRRRAHLILSGRGFPESLLPFADMVTEMEEVKHPWTSGKSAVQGIDF